MKKVLLVYCVFFIGCSQTEVQPKPEASAPSRTIAAVGDQESLGTQLCSKIHFNSREQAGCRKWVKSNLSLNVFDFAMTICNKGAQEARQANCLEEAGKNILVDNNFRIETQACAGQSSYSAKKNCYFKLFQKVRLPNW